MERRASHTLGKLSTTEPHLLVFRLSFCLSAVLYPTVVPFQLRNIFKMHSLNSRFGFLVASLNLSLSVSFYLLIPSSTLIHSLVRNPRSNVSPFVTKWKPPCLGQLSLSFVGNTGKLTAPFLCCLSGKLH